MEFADKVKEVVRTKAVAIDKGDIETCIKYFQNKMKIIPRIPSIIKADKKFDIFSVRTHISKDVYIILEDNVHQGPGDIPIIYIDIELNINYFTYAEILRKLIPLECTIGSFETVGDIIHLNLNEAQYEYKDIIGKIIHFKTGKTVINKTGQIESTFRYYQLELLAGTDHLETIHKENDIKIFLDLRKVYWCSRLQTERFRINKMVKKGESICDPFCGVGPQVLPLLKKGCKVYASDLNPSAIQCLQKSLALNKLKCDTIQNMDAAQFIESLEGKKIDHFVFNLPEHSLDYLKFLQGFSKFWIHCFFFCREVEDPVEMIKERTGFLVKSEWIRKVRKVSPSKNVLKLEIFSDDFFSLQ
jgi:tRNA (guanine37-N1)-methyltransferase